MVWETTASRALSGAEGGAQDGRNAVAQARDIGAPKGAAIYFAVDFDATNTQIAGDIREYFTAARDALGDDYVPGAYGPGAVCAFGLDHGLIRLAWVWAARRTNGTTDFIDSNRWHIRQHVPITPNTNADTLRIRMGYDPDDFKDDCGAFLINDSGSLLLGHGVAPPPATGGFVSIDGHRDRFVVTARDGLRLRSGPGLEFAVITTVRSGTEVTVLGLDGTNREWARVDLEGDGLADGHMFVAFLAPIAA